MADAKNVLIDRVFIVRTPFFSESQIRHHKSGIAMQQFQ